MSSTPAPPNVMTAPRGSWRALIVLLGGMFIALLDTTIVNVALPTIQTSLDASQATLTWIISGYALAFGIVLIPAGKLGDRYGQKWLFFGGLALFTVASAMCGLAQNQGQLIAARIVQGLAGGLFVPQVTALIQLLFPGAVRGKAFAVFGAVIGVATAVGPIVGGVIIQVFGDMNGWRLVFFVNVPIGALALVAAALLLPGGHEPSEERGNDWFGLLLLTAALVALLVPLIQGQDAGWPIWTFASLVGGLLLFVAFAAWQVRVSRRSRFPLVSPQLFTHGAFTGGVILALVYFAAFTSIFFTISILWQTGLGNSALAAGLVSIPFAIGSIFGSALSNRLSSRYGRGVLVLGTALVTVGLTSVFLVLTFVDPMNLTHWDLLPPLLVAGFGSGIFIAPNVQFIVATVERSQAGAASGVISVAQRIGSAIGIAVISTVLFGTLSVKGRSPAALADAFTASASYALAVSAGLSLIAFGLVFVLPKSTSSGSPTPKQNAADQESDATTGAAESTFESDGPKAAKQTVDA